MLKIPELLKATQGSLVSGDNNVIVKGVSIDSREIKKGEAFIAIKGNNFDGHNFIGIAIKKGASCIIVEKGPRRIGQKAMVWPPMAKAIDGVAVIKVKDTIRALGAIARFKRKKYNIPVIAVTGSNGKTTTKDMIAWVLSKDFKVLKNEGTKNNHIGLPLTLLKLDSSYDIVVLEIGTNHFGEVKYLSDIVCANIGIITNIGPAHLEYFKDLKGVFKEKNDLIRSLNAPAVAILNADDPYLRKGLFKKNSKPFAVGVGIRNKSDFSVSSIKDISGNYRFTVNQRFNVALNAPGYYNIYNSLMAIAVARIFGIEYRAIALRLSKFNPPKGRLNFIEIKKIKFIDDTYNSNPLSLRQALGLLNKIKTKGRKIVVMGDMLELGAASKRLHIQAIKEAVKICDTLITVGSISGSSLKEVCFGREGVFACQDSSQARDILLKKINVKPCDIILVKGSRMMKMEEVFNF